MQLQKHIHFHCKKLELAQQIFFRMELHISKEVV